MFVSPGVLNVCPDDTTVSQDGLARHADWLHRQTVFPPGVPGMPASRAAVTIRSKKSLIRSKKSLIRSKKSLIRSKKNNDGIKKVADQNKKVTDQNKKVADQNKKE